jgi:succinate dehydrogenase flavin-adding protein (antitoxin of CptAB toxin-antitoxin module)
MTTKPGIREGLWMGAGAALLLAAMFVVTLIRDARTPLERLAAKGRRADAAARMLTGLASSEAAERSALLAVTDDDVMRNVDEARTAMDDVERAHVELADLVTAESPESQRVALAKVSESFAELKRIDAGLLELLAKNTNGKATVLATGPAADAIREMDAALDRVVAAGAGSLEGARSALVARGAQVAALRTVAVLPRHIAEPSDRQKDEFEAVMGVEDEKLKKDLVDLGKFSKRGDDSDAATSWSCYLRFAEIRAKIVALSRENTNVKALAISLNQKQKALLVCRASLAALRQAIDDEPVPGLTHEPVAKPR